MRATVANLFEHLDKNSKEGLRRAYTNRTYYVIYHELRIFLEKTCDYDLSDKGEFGNMGSHVRVYEAFNDMLSKDKSNKALRSIALKFRDFLLKRHKADYNLEEDFSEYDLKQIEKYYQDIPNLVSQLDI